MRNLPFSLSFFVLSFSFIVYSLFIEFLPPRNRGKLLAILAISWSIGELLVTSSAWIILPRMSDDLGWRILLVISGLPGIGVFILSPWARESPRFLLVNGKHQEAMGVIRDIAERSGTNLAKSSRVVLSENECLVSMSSDDPFDTEAGEQSHTVKRLKSRDDLMKMSSSATPLIKHDGPVQEKPNENASSLLASRIPKIEIETSYSAHPEAVCVHGEDSEDDSQTSDKKKKIDAEGICAEVSRLFQASYRKLTSLLWLMWFFGSYGLYGLHFFFLLTSDVAEYLFSAVYS